MEMKINTNNDKPFSLPRGFAEKWVKALRSGNYEQGKNYLLNIINKGKKYCCLGVATDICNVPSEESRMKPVIFRSMCFKFNIPREICHIGGLRNLSFYLSMLNDYGLYSIFDTKDISLKFRFDKSKYINLNATNAIKYDFNMIADFIEDNCEFV